MSGFKVELSANCKCTFQMFNKCARLNGKALDAYIAGYFRIAGSSCPDYSIRLRIGNAKVPISREVPIIRHCSLPSPERWRVNSQVCIACYSFAENPIVGIKVDRRDSLAGFKLKIEGLGLFVIKNSFYSVCSVVEIEFYLHEHLKYIRF